MMNVYKLFILSVLLLSFNWNGFGIDMISALGNFLSAWGDVCLRMFVYETSRKENKMIVNTVDPRYLDFGYLE